MKRPELSPTTPTGDRDVLLRNIITNLIFLDKKILSTGERQRALVSAPASYRFQLQKGRDIVDGGYAQIYCCVELLQISLGRARSPAQGASFAPMMSPLFDLELGDRIADCGIVAVLILERVEDAVPVASSLVAGGITAMELTLRTPVALKALEQVRAEVPEMIAGVGTILTPEQVQAAKSSGAQFGVAPGMNRRVLVAAREAGLSFAPGVATPSDIEAALEHECHLLKFFPAEPSGGLPYLDCIAAPYLHVGIKFIPLGGLNPSNMGSYLADPKIAALGGSWLAPRNLIKAGSWKEITQLASEAAAAIKSIRTKPL
jgi:2-dehydro-3-deoxyphosphogluconate aldolase/(4S)-4-hydroxy-2-oxoglutarate aldolase